MPKVTINTNQERKDIQDAVTQALSDLDLIINNIDTATTAQIKNAVKTLAQHQKKIIKRLVQV